MTFRVRACLSFFLAGVATGAVAEVDRAAIKERAEAVQQRLNAPLEAYANSLSEYSAEYVAELRSENFKRFLLPDILDAVKQTILESDDPARLERCSRILDALDSLLVKGFSHKFFHAGTIQPGFTQTFIHSITVKPLVPFVVQAKEFFILNSLDLDIWAEESVLLIKDFLATTDEDKQKDSVQNLKDLERQWADVSERLQTGSADLKELQDLRRKIVAYFLKNRQGFEAIEFAFPREKPGPFPTGLIGVAMLLGAYALPVILGTPIAIATYAYSDNYPVLKALIGPVVLSLPAIMYHASWVKENFARMSRNRYQKRVLGNVTGEDELSAAAYCSAVFR